MTQNEVDIIKNSVLDSTEAYVEARLNVLNYVKTQIGVVVNATKDPSNKKWYHTVRCNKTQTTEGITYNNVLSVNNIHFKEDSVVFLAAPNAQFSSQFILGKLDNVPYDIVGGSISIGGTEEQPNFYVDSNGNCTCKNLTANVGGSIAGWTISSNGLSHGEDAWVEPANIACGEHGATLVGMRGRTSGNSGYMIVGVNEDTDCVKVFYNNIKKYDANGNSINVQWNSSDISLKKNIENLSLNESKKFIENLIPRKFEMKEKEGIRYGFIAQEVDLITDNNYRIVEDNDEGTLKFLNYNDILAPLIKVVQEQQKQIDKLKQEVKKND